MGDDFHRCVLENQHRMFVKVYKNTQKANKQQSDYTNKKNKCKEVELKVGDSVFYKNHTKSNKLENNWKTHYIIVEKTSPVSFRIRNQLTGRVAKAHANSLRVNNTSWKIPKAPEGV